MPDRTYPITQKYTKRDGTVSIYKIKNKKKIKSNKPYKPQKRGSAKPSIVSSRFGLLDLYNRKEQQQLICPSGYSISQCFNVLRKMCFAYRASLHKKNIVLMEKYARAIQDIQKDMGIKTTSFPHLGIYGDQFILNNKQGGRVVFEDHSAMKRRQDEYDKWAAENAKEIQKHVQKPDENEEIITFADDVYPYEEVEPQEDEIVPHMLVPDKGQRLIVMPDLVPFQKRYNNYSTEDDQ